MNTQNVIVYVVAKGLMLYGAYVLTTKYILPAMAKHAPAQPSTKAYGAFVR